ncbi:MAG: GntR family transcriptional regulator [Actinomycetota bacterium]
MQIAGRVRRAVEVGRVGPGDRLPTVRELAAELGVAPNTVVRAYEELRRMGLVESRLGVGTVISRDAEDIGRERRVETLLARLRELVRDAAALGVSQDELWDIVDAEFERVRDSAGL